MEGSKYYEDKRKEELFGTWLDKHFYSRIIPYYKEITRVSDITIQKKGVDVIIEKEDGKKIYIDEKATLHYINKKIPTFAFEIMNMTSGTQGWLYNPDYITDYYVLAWPNATDERIPDAEAFVDTEIMCIERSKVLQLLTDKGLTENRILDLVKYYKSQLSKAHKFEIAPEIQLNFNMTLAEKPINIVVKKKLLEQYADSMIKVK